MARYSSAYSGLIRRIDEIQAIISIARGISRVSSTQPNPFRVNALCRGGIVLLCSHVEGYVEDLGALAINSLAKKNLPKTSMSLAFRYHLSRDLIDDINSTTDPESIASKVVNFLARDGHIWDATPHFTDQLPVETFVRNFATPRHDNIRRFFGRFGYQDFQTRINGATSKQLSSLQEYGGPCRRPAEQNCPWRFCHRRHSSRFARYVQAGGIIL